MQSSGRGARVRRRPTSQHWPMYSAVKGSGNVPKLSTIDASEPLSASVDRASPRGSRAGRAHSPVPVSALDAQAVETVRPPLPPPPQHGPPPPSRGLFGHAHSRTRFTTVLIGMASMMWTRFGWLSALSRAISVSTADRCGGIGHAGAEGLRTTPSYQLSAPTDRPAETARACQLVRPTRTASSLSSPSCSCLTATNSPVSELMLR